MFHGRTKHIEIDVHYLRKQVSSKNVSIQCILSQHQVVGVVTKPLLAARLEMLRSKLQIVKNIVYMCTEFQHNETPKKSNLTTVYDKSKPLKSM